MHTYTHTHTYIHTYLPTYLPTYLHAHTHTYTHTYMHTCIHTHTHTHTHIHTYIHHMRAYIHAPPINSSTCAPGPRGGGWVRRIGYTCTTTTAPLEFLLPNHARPPINVAYGPGSWVLDPGPGPWALGPGSWTVGTGPCDALGSGPRAQGRRQCALGPRPWVVRPGPMAV